MRSYCWPITCETRADAGTADTPALPIRGFILFLVKRFIILAKITPVAVATEKAAAPIRNILIVAGVKNTSAVVFAPTVKPISTVTTSISTVLADWARRSVTPLSFSKLPRNSMANSTTLPGEMKVVTTKATSGKNIFSFLETTRSDFMRISRSFLVVNSRMMGGWITGTNAIYEYAAKAIEPNRWGASLEARNMEVGPSAPPIMPMEAASITLNPSRMLPMNVAKIPNCAAAPNRMRRGLAIRVLKSVIAPMPRKIKEG